ncbi:putative neddylation of cullins play an essential role in the regulation of SCF-type complexes activity [Lyophyllum shimeji]|uniref:Defective in cullin neddylation protein n=1 Tax=Lyophyllum shimeji TaxID=47721 RepID=A0A9P3PZI5_LYOSH|nr:putative neddylation of cullins play an essential role in the regulation of SCF-type complexes activity [Lyophyllum shimeji]
MADRKMDDNVAQFCAVTGASTKDARSFLQKYKRADVAIDAYYNNPAEFATSSRHSHTAAPSTSKLTTLFSRYKDPNADEITIDGTIKLCEDLEVNPEDVVLLAVAFELKSKRMGEWNKQGWVEGWKSLGCDSIAAMKAILPQLRNRLATDPAYFQKVYKHTFDFARAEGQRSLAIDTAQDFWKLLIPHGLAGGAVSHTKDISEDGDVSMEHEEGWQPDYLEWWFEFLNEKGGKGVSKDTWGMFLDFVRTINATFTNYDMEAAWPSTIDDFVKYAKARLGSPA